MPKPPPVVEVGSPRPRKAILIHDDDDDRSGGHGRHRESRPVVGMGGYDGRRAKGEDRFGGSERGRKGSSVGGREVAGSPSARRNPLAPSSPAVARAGAREPEVIELDNDEEGYKVHRANREKAAARVEVRGLVKEEPLKYPSSDSEDSRARGRARAAASAPGGSGKARKRKRGDESSGAPAKVKSAGRRRHVHKGGGRGRHDAAPSRQVGLVDASRARSRNGDQRKLASAAKYRSPVFSEDSGDDDYHYSSGGPAKVKSAGRRRRGHKGGGSDWRGSAPSRQVGAVVSSRTHSRNGDRRKVASAAKCPAAPLVSDYSGDDDEMNEVSSDDNREPRDNKEEEDVVKGKNKVDDNGDSEDMYKSVEEEEPGEEGNGIHDDSYAGVGEEDTDGTTEREEEEEDDDDDEEEEEGKEEEKESHEAGEDLPRTPSSNAKTGGNARPDGDGTPPVRTKTFEGLLLVDKADTTSAGDGLRKRTRLQRRCSDKKLLTRGTFSKPYCIDVSESEPEEEVPPPAQTKKVQPSDWAFEDDSGGDERTPEKKRRRRQQTVYSDDSDSEDGTNDSESEEDKTFTMNTKKGPSSGRPTNGGAPYRQQQTATAKQGCKDSAGCSNPRRVKNYAGNPADRGNLRMQGDISFKKNALLPQKGKKHGGLSAERDAYDNLFNSIFYGIENHPNGSAPAQAQQGVYTQPLIFSFGDEDEVEEKSEHEKYMDELWAEMDLGLEIINASREEGEESNGQKIPPDTEPLRKEGKKHDFFTDEQIGIVCRHCYFVQTEIGHVMPPMGKWSEERDPRADHEFDRSIKDFNDMLTSMGYEGDYSIVSHRSGPVWDLIPGVQEDMFPHQREAFEFMWNKLAGGIDIEQVKENVKNDALSGCVISHAPGTGKTRLATTFVQSYLELFPRCSPVIIAPKVMLATWEHEFRKWNAKVPFHVLNSTHIHWDGDKTIQRLAANDDDLTRNLLDNEFRRDVKLLSWSEGNSVIGLSYKLFTNLAKEEGEDNNGKDSNKMRQLRKVLLERPDLLVLDEGHIPRNNKSKIWKALAQVRTEKRIILSGTPFQNNFEELYNILCLLRGSAHDVDSKLPGKDEGKGFWTSLTLNNVTDERVNEIRTKLDPFVHIHNGDILQKSLPGLRESVVILNPLPMQKKIIAMMEKSETQCNFHFEYKISLASVHPSLITSINKLSDEITSTVDEPSLERIRLKPCEGVKARFVYEIVRRCRSKERVLVFSQYLEPLDLIMEQLSKEFHWTKGKEILQMSGKVGVETRQSMIMAFNDMNSDAKVMLATTKACGEGIQLIGASRVVLLDVVWNPSVGRQAIGRAYRIGQEKIVYTYNLIAEGTQEKSKYDRQAKKDHMSKLLFSNESQPAQCNQSPEFIFSDRILEDMTEDENLKEMFVNILPSQ